MLGYFAVTVSTFIASVLSFFSGFGLGTILMPVVAIFFPLPLAIALTAVIHLLHNLLKTTLLWKGIDWTVVAKFGVSALLAAIPGALLLKALSSLTPINAYSFLGIKGEFSLLHICIGLLLIFFGTVEAFPYKAYRIKNLVLGGIISGFLGGLSGNQGALRSVFLINTHLDRRAFIGTNAMIAVAVDLVRLIVYSLSFHHLLMVSSLPLLGISLISAAGGVFLGMTLLNKITIKAIQKIIVILLYLFGVLLILGII